MHELQDLTRAIVAFRDRRDWKQFHSLRNLAAGLSIEAAERWQEMIFFDRFSSSTTFSIWQSENARQTLGDKLVCI